MKNVKQYQQCQSFEQANIYLHSVIENHIPIIWWMTPIKYTNTLYIGQRYEKKWYSWDYDEPNKVFIVTNKPYCLYTQTHTSVMQIPTINKHTQKCTNPEIEFKKKHCQQHNQSIYAIPIPFCIDFTQTIFRV